MRIWHSQLIPKLCRQHLLACWREALGAWIILTENKKGYRNHPAVSEFRGAEASLWDRLYDIRQEMRTRGYNPKDLPPLSLAPNDKDPQEWQDLDTQTEVLKAKNCNCDV